MREIEIKINVDSLEIIKAKLTQAGCIFSEPLTQHDTIYSSINNNEKDYSTSKTDHIFMRIRTQNEKSIFNLKKQMTGELDNIEFETQISDPVEMQKILLLLGYEPKVEVKKTREKCKYKDYEICLDAVEGLGCFVEIEKLTDDDADYEKVKKELVEVLVSFGLDKNKIEERGYDTQIMHKKTGN